MRGFFRLMPAREAWPLAIPALYAFALAYGGGLWLHQVHRITGLAHDTGAWLSEATVELPLVLMAVCLALPLSRATSRWMPRALASVGAPALVALAVGLALIADGLITLAFYPQSFFVATNPFLCDALGLNSSGLAGSPALRTLYETLVTLPALLLIALALGALAAWVDGRSGEARAV
ncbi:MAG: hypothetical protein OHK0015_33860 [Chloroflexi bacterium OHK40]